MTTKHRISALSWNESIADELYDRQLYLAHGVTPSEFFQIPMSEWKLLRDTNMHLPGFLPAGLRFLVTGIEAIFLPAQGLSKAQRFADINAAARSGVVSFRICNRIFMQTAPLASCPAAKYWDAPLPNDGDRTLRAMISAQLSEQFRETDYGAFGGKSFDLEPVFIESPQPFGVQVTELAPLPSGKDGELWIRLVGRRIRPAS